MSRSPGRGAVGESDFPGALQCNLECGVGAGGGEEKEMKFPKKFSRHLGDSPCSSNVDLN